MAKQYFSKGQAEKKLGVRIKSLRGFSGVPKGTTGTVVRMDEGSDALYSLGIEWNLPGRKTPLVDWFSADEFENFLREE